MSTTVAAQISSVRPEQQWSAPSRPIGDDAMNTPERAAWLRLRDEVVTLDSVKHHHQMMPATKARAERLAAEGYIDTSGTWKLTDKGEKLIADFVAEEGSIWGRPGR